MAPPNKKIPIISHPFCYFNATNAPYNDKSQ